MHVRQTTILSTPKTHSQVVYHRLYIQIPTFMYTNQHVHIILVTSISVYKFPAFLCVNYHLHNILVTLQNEGSFVTAHLCHVKPIFITEYGHMMVFGCHPHRHQNAVTKNKILTVPLFLAPKIVSQVTTPVLSRMATFGDGPDCHLWYADLSCKIVSGDDNPSPLIYSSF